MKKNKKILLIAAGIILVLLISSLLVLRNDMWSALNKAGLESNYETVAADNFDRLDFSDQWIVKIRQGRGYKVQLAVEQGAGLKPRLENIGGTLYFKVEEADARDTQKVHAKVTMPDLKEVKAAGGTKIYLENFESDSLSILLENGVAFTGKNNHFNHISFKTSGEALIQLTGDPDE